MSDVYEIENDGANYSSHGAIAELVVKKNEIMQMKKEILHLKELLKEAEPAIEFAKCFSHDSYKKLLEEVEKLK